MSKCPKNVFGVPSYYIRMCILKITVTVLTNNMKIIHPIFELIVLYESNLLNSYLDIVGRSV